MNLPNIDISNTVSESAHSLSAEEIEALKLKFLELKRKVETEGYEMTLDDQKIVVDWLRADRETKFILNSKPVKVPKEKVVKVKKPKKLNQKALGLLIIKEMKGEELTEEEARNKHFTLTGEIL